MEAKNHINSIEILWKQTSVIYVTSIVFLEDTFIFLLKSMCSIPDDCIDPRRLPLFISRGFLRDLMSTLEPRQIEEESQ